MADDLRVFYKIHVGSLSSAFATARHSRLAVKLVYGFALSLRFPSEANQPLNASITFWEASSPLKLSI